jgi:two-component system sensor histidine kinase VicK
MRWWLALAFAAIAAITAVATASLADRRSRHGFRERAAEIAAGRAFQAAVDLTSARESGAVDETVARLAERHDLALFVFDSNGDLRTSSRSHNVSLRSIAERREAVATALRGRRFIATNPTVRATVVGLPVAVSDGAVLMAYASHPQLAEGLGIVRTELVRTAVFAFLLAGTVGLIVATLIAERLRRIGAAAAAIEAGDFERELRPRFNDEVGRLAATIDRMRVRLRDSFTALRADRDRLSSLVDRLQDGVAAVDERLVVQISNHRAGELLGAALHPGVPLPDPWPGFPLRARVSDLFAPDAGVMEATVRAGDDDVYALVGLPPHDGTGNAILVVTDLSEGERRERVEREFIANAAHELRTPLTTIQGAVELLRDGAADDARERDRFLAHIERETARLGRLARGLLLLARAEAGVEAPRLAPVPVRELLDEAAARVETKPSVEVRVDCPPGLEAVAEPDLAEHIVLNLVENAARATEKGTILLNARAQDGEVAIEVRDTGAGIPPSELDRVFERFYRPKGRGRDGFGLGLAIVRQATEVLGGRVTVESAPGRGTVARVVLKRAT